MYLHLLLLISPALGMPSSLLIDSEEEIIKQLEALPDFTEETKALFKNITKEIYKIVSEKLAEAENSILELHIELKKLESQDLKFKEDYFKEFNEAKRYLRESRQKVRKLADRTVKEVGILKGFLKDLDESNDIVLLQASLDKMKILMIETLETLEEAVDDFNSAQQTFQDLNSYITQYNGELGKKVDELMDAIKDAEAQRAAYVAIPVTTTLAILFDILGCLGICSAINVVASSSATAAIEVGAAKKSTDLENFKRIMNGLTESGKDFERAINEAMFVLGDEIELMYKWTNSAEIVQNNLKDKKYSVKYLRKYKSFRVAFVKGLDDLENNAQEFLARPIEIL